MQRRRGAVEADIGRERARTRLFVQPRKIGALMDIAALLHHAQKIGAGLERFGHGLSSGNSARGLGKRNGICNRAGLGRGANARGGLGFLQLAHDMRPTRIIAVSHPFRFLLCAPAALLIFGSEPSAFLAARAQVAEVAAPLPKFRGTHRARAFHHGPIGARYNGGIVPASRRGAARPYTTSAIGGIGGAADVGGPALTQWRFGREIGGVPDVGGPALNGGFGGIGGGPDVGGPALNGGLIGGPPRIGAPRSSAERLVSAARGCPEKVLRIGELGPIRVNTISSGLVWRFAALDSACGRLSAGRPNAGGRQNHGVFFLMDNRGVNGIDLEIDGGAGCWSDAPPHGRGQTARGAPGNAQGRSAREGRSRPEGPSAARGWRSSADWVRGQGPGPVAL